MGADIDGEAAGDYNGFTVSINSDGTIIATGGHLNDGIALNAGHVRVYKYQTIADATWTNYNATSFSYTGTSPNNKPIVVAGGDANPVSGKFYWVQMGVDIEGESVGEWAGYSVSLSADGQIVAFGAPRNDGITNNTSNANTIAGQVRVYKYDVNKITSVTDQSSNDFGPIGWRRLGKDINGGEANNDHFGWSVSLSADGTIVAIGAYLNDGNGSNSGSVRIYKYNGLVWNQICGDIDGEVAGDNAGGAVAISGDGRTVAIGASLNDGAGPDRGHVRVYQIQAIGNKLSINRQAEINGLTIGSANADIITNSAIGYQSLNAVISGNQNSAYGYQALLLNTTGNNNTAFGYQAGDLNTTGSNNTFLGSLADTTNTWSNSTAIGYNARITASNQIALGTATEIVNVPGKLSIIGDASFNGRLDICGNFYAQYPASSIPSSAINGGVTQSYIDTSLNLKANLASPTFTGTVGGITQSMVGLGNVDNTSDANKPISTATQTALDLKASITYVDASLNMKPSFSQVDASLNLKPVFSQVDASLNLKSDITYVDASLNLKPAFSQVDASLNLKSNITYVDASLNLKPAFSQVDASLNLKANLESPIFTGTVTAPKLTSGDASFNGNVDISGVLSVRQTVNSVVTNTTINNYNVAVTNDLSLNGKLLVSLDVSLNSKLYVNSDASFNGRVDICGNFYAQYPAASIPSSAINGGVTQSYIDTSLNLKAPLANPTFTGTVSGITKSMVDLANVDNTSDANKPISTATQSALDLKVSSSVVDTSLNLKANLASPTFTGTVGGITKSMVGLANADNTSDANKPISTATQTALDLKVSSSVVDTSLNLKANLASPMFTGTVYGITQSMVGLANVDNTSDANKPISTATQSALNLKASISNTDASLNLKPSFSQVDASLNLKPSFAQVDASLNLKANLASPTFTGIVTLPTITSGDASFNGNLDISGVLSVKQTVNSVVTNTTINNYNVAVTNDLSLNGKLLVSSDVSLNSKLYVNGDASFNGNVGISGEYLRFANSHLRNNATNSRLEYNVNTGYSHSQRINNVEKLAIKDDGNGSTLQLPSCQIREYTPFSWLYYNIPTAWTYKFDVNTTTALQINGTDGLLVSEAVNMNNNKKIIWYENFVNAASISKNTVTSAFEYAVATGYKHSWLVNNVEGMSLGSKLIVASDASFNSKLSVGNDVSFNSKLYVKSDASFNGRVDICGNFYAQYPASSIPSSAIIGGVGGGGGGSSIDYAQLDASLNLKANLASPTFTGIVTLPKVTSGDASFNGNVDISGVLSVKQTVNSVVTNTTINNYNVAVTNDISLNGNLRASGQITAASFNATSDYRIKSNILPLSDCSFGIDALAPVTYHNKITDREDIGFIAHELQPHFPFLVTGEKDGDAIQTVNYTGLIGLLVHELQQLKKNAIPQNDLIYRGSVQLTNGVAQVNLDNRFNMPEGTFAAFNDVTVFTSNETGWDPVRGSINGNNLTIECMVNTSNAKVSYLVAAKPK